MHGQNFPLESMLKPVKKTLLSLIPKNRYGDKFYAFIKFSIRHKRFPKNDKLIFNDVLYKIKTTNEILNPLRVFVSDKEFVKIYVKAIVGDKYNVPTIGVIRNSSDVDSYEFPPDCYIKPTHASGLSMLRRNNAPVDKEKIKQWFNIKYYETAREANYKTLQPKVIIEPILFGDVNINDYKFFCVNGAVKLIQVDIDRYTLHRRVIFDSHWNPQDYSICYPKSLNRIDKPKNFDEMRDVAGRLAAGFGFVRVDLYSNGNICLVGEITNCHGNAGENFIPPSGEAMASKIIFGNA